MTIVHNLWFIRKIKLGIMDLKSQSDSEDSEFQTDNEDLENTFKFSPPLYRQRYEKVIELLGDIKWKEKLKSLVDFGCAEFKLFTLLKNGTDLERISLVDVDESLLEERIMLVNPLAAEFLRKRKHPLKVSVFAGSVTDPDDRLVGHDVVTAVELIEHLYPDEIEAFSYNIFGFIRPKIVMITTPNAEFNVMFSNDPNRLRHYDHKFEWTREQFEDWGNNVTDRFFDYNVTFCGIGKGSEDIEVGECSQMALFFRKDLLEDNIIISPCNCSTLDNIPAISDLKTNARCSSCLPKKSYGICTYQNISSKKYLYEVDDKKETSQDFYYKCIKEVSFPYEIDDRTDEQKLVDEIRYRINNIVIYLEPVEIEGNFQYKIPLKHLLTPNENVISLEELRILLNKCNFKVEDCINRDTENVESSVIIPQPEEEYSDSDSSLIDSDYESYHSNGANSANLNDEDWDKELESHNVLSG